MIHWLPGVVGAGPSSSGGVIGTICPIIGSNGVGGGAPGGVRGTIRGLRDLGLSCSSFGRTFSGRRSHQLGSCEGGKIQADLRWAAKTNLPLGRYLMSWKQGKQAQPETTGNTGDMIAWQTADVTPTELQVKHLQTRTKQRIESIKDSKTKTKNKRRWYPQQRGGLTIPFYTNAFTLRTALPAPLCQPQDGKNLVPHVFCSSWSQNLRNPIETWKHRNFRNRQNHQNPSKPGTPQLSKPWNPSKPGTSETFKTTATFQTWGTQSLEPGTFARPHPSKTGTSSRNRPWGPGTCRNPSKPGTGPEPVPGTRFLPGTAPTSPEHTEIYIVQRPHSILLLGKNKTNKKKKMYPSEAPKPKPKPKPKKTKPKKTKNMYPSEVLVLVWGPLMSPFSFFGGFCFFWFCFFWFWFCLVLFFFCFGFGVEADNLQMRCIVRLLRQAIEDEMHCVGLFSRWDALWSTFSADNWRFFGGGFWGGVTIYIYIDMI